MLFAGIGVFFIKPELLSTSLFPPTKNIFFAAAVLFVAYEGFGLITNAAEDVESPEKTLPKALYLSVLIVIAIYLSVSLTVTGNLPLSDIIKARDYALAEAARLFLGSLGFKIMAVAALFSTASAINATLYGGANVSYMIAKNGELPKVFERTVWGQSFEGLFITAGLVILFANSFDLSGIAMLGCFFALTTLVYYLLDTSPVTLTALFFVIMLSFVGEWTFRRYTNRRLKTRKCKRPIASTPPVCK